MIPANSPFSVVLESVDEGKTLAWKILDGEGRVHLKGDIPTPDFLAGQGLVITIDIETTEGSENLAGRLERLPVDAAIVEAKLGKGFAEALTEDQ